MQDPSQNKLKTSGLDEIESSISPNFDSISSDEGDLCDDGQEIFDLEQISGSIDTRVKPHFLDYDYHHNCHNDVSKNHNEHIKNDKCIERDGEVTDLGFALICAGKSFKHQKTKKKHFLDENPIPPEYMIKTDAKLNRNIFKEDETEHVEINVNKSDSENYTLNRFAKREMPILEKFGGTWPSYSVNSEKNESHLQTIATCHSVLGPKVECVYSLLNMLGQNDPTEMASKFFELSRNRENCIALRKSGCISILVQLVHSDSEELIRKKAGAALHNVVHCHIDDKSGRREVRVLRLIELLLEYCELLRSLISNGGEIVNDSEKHPIVAIGTLMKTSFDEDHRHAMCFLGAIQTISKLVQLDHEAHGAKSQDQNCITLRRYAGMTLTNLTFGDGNNKALLCSNKNFMKSLITQIESNSDELVQVTASVLRNLSWRADSHMKLILSEIGAVKILTKSAMNCKQENTLKSILSALWNLSNHCSSNKAEFCECEGAIDFLIDMLNYDAPSKTMSVVENAGGILRNISSHIASKEEYRQIIRKRNCLGILLQQLKSSSLTVVSNASGTLGNLSANCPEDQKFLRENGAIPMLRSLIYSKHKMISSGSSVALKNLLNFQKNETTNENLDSVLRTMDFKELPSLNVRKQRALEHELNKNLSNSFDCEDITTPPKDEQSLIVDQQHTKTELMRGKYMNQKSGEMENSKNIDENEAIESIPTYQETDLDQPVNFSIKYAENFMNSEDDCSSRAILVDEDYVQTYFTEDTPKLFSSQGSSTDLRTAGVKINSNNIVYTSKPIKNSSDGIKKNVQNNGIFTPENPIKYSVEGTPREFSRCDSLNDLGEVNEIVTPSTTETKDENSERSSNKLESQFVLTKTVKFSNYSQAIQLETPLMYSRHSSVESLESAGSICIADDKSSVVSDFSRLASGIISPSELPDSPTQNFNGSPQQKTKILQQNLNKSTVEPNIFHSASVFEDQTNVFGIEHTPAHLSCKTSLSNLSFDDEPKITKDCLIKEMRFIDPSKEQEDILEDYNVDDNYLLEQAISIGIQSSTTRKPGVGASCGSSDTTNKIYSENTPAHLAKTGSYADLTTFLSINQDNSGNLSSNFSDIENELLEEVIQDGIINGNYKEQNSQQTESLMDRLRKGVIVPYNTYDETKQFKLEDTPKTFSVASELSGITIESDIIQLAKLKKKSLDELPKLLCYDMTNEKGFDDSLSSLSIDSNDDELNVLYEVIADGAKTFSSDAVQQHKINSFSSVDLREDTNDMALLDQTVQNGMEIVTKKTQTSGCIRKPGNKHSKKHSKKTIENHEDTELLDEMIRAGISKTIGHVTVPKPLQSESCSIAENAISSQTKDETLPINKNTKENNFIKEEVEHQQVVNNELGKNLIGAVNVASTNSIIEMNQYNQFPPLKICSYNFDNYKCDSHTQLTNEFISEKKEVKDKLCDRRKNPDVMLKSVDRLTQHLVAAAEFAHKTQQNDINGTRVLKNSGTNTWNEDSLSFPSISIDAPNVKMMLKDENINNDDTKSTTDEILCQSSFTEKVINVKPLLEPTIHGDKNVNNEHFKGNDNDRKPHEKQCDPVLRFELGGKVNHGISSTSFTSSGPMSIDTHSTLSSTMIYIEANKVAIELQKHASVESISNLDINEIRPPSELGCVSLSTITYDTQFSPQLPIAKKKSLQTGFVARRALGQLASRGSDESINSLGSTNLEKIKPPSIMDELLDSMISVASITSEIADVRITTDNSHYETAFSEIDDSTMKSYLDLPYENDATPVQSDFSSYESSPVGRRSLTPKQKRQISDRYKTYTISGNSIDTVRGENEEILRVEIDEQQMHRLSTIKKNDDNCTRLCSQTIDSIPFNFISSSFKTNTDISANDIYTNKQNQNFVLFDNNKNGHSTSKSVSPSLTCIKDKNGAINKKFDLVSTEFKQSSNAESLDHNCEFNKSIGELTKSRVQKPSNKLYFNSDDKEGSSMKKNIVKGKKKAAYVSPYKNPQLISNVTTKQEKPVHTKLIGAKKNNNPICNKTISKTNLTYKLSSKIHSINKNSNESTRITHINKSKTYTDISSCTLKKMPDRQNTFIKEEGTNLNVPVVTSVPTTPPKLNKISCKIPSKTRTVSKARNLNSQSCSTKDENIIENRKPAMCKALNGNKSYHNNTSTLIKNANSSNYSKTVTNSVQPSRNQKDMTNKIANIWKKIDESKKQHNSTNDTRVWIANHQKS
uniref:CSON002259 protein n=1 Tax=Culicoides sonorensis TaxID=179676 RepID=A0A336LWK2_CULSO